MIVKLFDIDNGVVKPTEHCYTIKFLKDIMDAYPEDFMKIYSYLFYMTCPSADLNPFFNTPQSDKEELIIEQVDIDFSIDDDLIVEGLKLCKKLYETPTSRAYNGIKMALDKIADYMSETEITHGRDGNINSITNTAAKYQQIRDSFKGAYNDLVDEQKSHVRGGIGLSYDQD